MIPRAHVSALVLSAAALAAVCLHLGGLSAILAGVVTGATAAWLASSIHRGAR